MLQKDAQCTSLNTSSNETLDFIQKSLARCRAEHSACSLAMPNASWYPTRLIQVSQDSVNLVESAETDIVGSYATLSHCWGGAEILKLKKGNLSDLKQDVVVSSLPQTFKDAIIVIRNLGIPYIWIDSLCIIQDSDEDWQREARTMLKVYEHATCNIAATHSPNSFGGLFADRNPRVLDAESIEIDNGVLVGRFHLVDVDYFTQEIDDAPLNRRCWVTQERVLSTRIIHFASEQVIWDCNELTACESLPQGTNTWPDSPSTHFNIGCKLGSTFLTPTDTVDKGLGKWARIVDTYSACGLTVLTDKLMAISGVADHLRNNFSLEYCVGLWRSRLEIQLAWYVREPQPGRSVRNDLAPSWSWASVNGSVDLQQIDLYEPYDIKPLVSIVDVDLKRQVENGRGEKVMGFLRMRCSLNPVSLQGGPKDYRLTGPGMEHAKQVWADDSKTVGGENLFVVPLFDLQTPYSLEDTWKISSEVRGIIVQAVESKKGIFTRCGHVFLAGRIDEITKAFDPSYEGLWSLQGKAGFPCQEYDSISGHLITLI
ncbi:hypothetical protein AK830_g7021 [Neonectria ditissima]|uniref:Heterokaryon incompatibility domain-containing protein n=1 Tax=Neonectria ditissima TaxID=78410 RepID=A0A0N8H6P3_9HYPO|nr:hypothetical protein AK830_g7021 [Neonectria ditissima]